MRTYIKKWKPVELALLAALALALVSGAASLGRQDALQEKMIRLHVIANSDSQADQALKLQVRDQVLAQADTLLSGQESAQQAAEILRDNLTPLAETAARTVSQAGFSYQVQVSLEDTWFPTRQYGDLSLPAGQYQALRVVIGQGEGKNWWCVVFPSLCLPAVSEQALQTAGLTGQDYALLTESSQPYVIKFKALEWWGSCRSWLASRR